MKLGSRGHGRLVLLFLIAVILPSLALVLFTLRMIRQERELGEKRRLDDQGRLAAEIGRFLLLRLENIRLQETAGAVPPSRLREYRNPEVVLVGRVVRDQMLLPWEDGSAKDAFLRDLSQPEFSQNIRSGEKEEFENRNPAGAAACFNRALGFARDPNQRAYAHLLLARALVKTGETERALEQYRALLEASAAGADEHGIHLSLYACRSLLELGRFKGEVLKAVTAQLRQNHWHPPAEAYLLKDLLGQLAQGATEPDIGSAAASAYQESVEYVGLIEHVLALQRDFGALRLMLSDHNSSSKPTPSWALYSDVPWLVGLTPAESEILLVAVRARDVLESASSELSAGRVLNGNARLVQDSQIAGAWLGPNFPGVRIVFSDADPSWSPAPWSAQRSLYWLALSLVLGVTLFGSYLLWRDIRRELQVAEMRSQFVSSVSHELKTPLTAIRMFAETLSLGRSRNPENQREYLETIVNESERLTRLLNNVLDFSKIEMGRMAYRPKPASLADIVRAAARTVQYPLSQQGFTLNVHIQDGMPDACVDCDAIEQAILNLLSNAMKYSGDARDIDLCLLRRGGNAVIQVSDHGTGIDPQEQKKIFEKFYRVSSPENKRIAGTGLGLALVAHTVKAHSGRIEVASMPGKGSTFSIFLPLEGKP
jgi:signal transduction histidine kinase